MMDQKFYDKTVEEVCEELIRRGYSPDSFRIYPEFAMITDDFNMKRVNVVYDLDELVVDVWLG